MMAKDVELFFSCVYWPFFFFLLDFRELSVYLISLFIDQAVWGFFLE